MNPMSQMAGKSWLSSHCGPSIRKGTSTGLIAVVGCLFLTAISQAQVTNTWLLPATRLEAVQTNIGKVIIKATAQVGTLSAGAGALSVSYS
jgi:hypothetical protein